MIFSGQMTAEELRVAAHDKLGDVLSILKDILQKYPALHTTDVLTTAAMLITKIKSKLVVFIVDLVYYVIIVL